MGGPASTRAHPFFGGLDRRIHLPNRRPLRMVARSYRDEVEISRLLRSLSFTFSFSNFRKERRAGVGCRSLPQMRLANMSVMYSV